MSSSASSSSSSLVILDAEPIDLRQPPPSSSRAVRTARDHLLSDLDITTLSDDLSRVSRLLSLSRTAAFAAGYLPLATHLTTLSTKVLTLFDSTSVAVLHFRLAADAVLSDLAHNHALMSSRQLSPALANLVGNDDLAGELAAAARTLSDQLAAAADDAADALEAAQSRRAACEEDRAKLEDRMTELNVRKAAAWHTHDAVLESLSEAGRLYARAAKTERRAARRATFFSLLGFVDIVDSFLIGTFNLPLLTPVRRFLDGVREDVVKATEQKKALLTAKKRQRKLNREALEDISECSRRIREVKSDADAVLAAIESLHAVARELKRLSVVVMRMAAFWAQLHANMGRLSSKDLVRLIRATAEPELLEEGESRADGARVGEHDGPGEGSTVAGGGDGEKGVIDVSGPQELWAPCSAVKRKLVGYYARWVALSDVSGQCLMEIVDARSGVAKAIEEQAEVGELSPQDARLQVAKMAASLRREMDEINNELGQSRKQLAAVDAASSAGQSG